MPELSLPYAKGPLSELQKTNDMCNMNTAQGETCRAIIKKLESVQNLRHFNFRTIFDDFCEIATGGFHNKLYSIGKLPVPECYRAAHDWLEKSYQHIFTKYGSEAFDIFSHALAMIVLAMREEPFDYLGKIYMEMRLGNNGAGQFFTPPHICELMTHLNMGGKENFEHLLSERGWIGACDPCCGSGAMMVGLAKVLCCDYGITNLDAKVCIHLTDIDYLCVKMAFMNMSILDLSARVVHGNAITKTEEIVFDTPNMQMANMIGTFRMPENAEKDNPEWREQSNGQLMLF